MLLVLHRLHRLLAFHKEDQLPLKLRDLELRLKSDREKRKPFEAPIATRQFEIQGSGGGRGMGAGVD